MSARKAEGVLLTGVYGSGKSSVAEEITYLLEHRATRTRCSTWAIELGGPWHR